jgi:hypothetical protein
LWISEQGSSRSCSKTASVGLRRGELATAKARSRFPEGMTERKAKAKAKARAKANANAKARMQGSLHCAALRSR